MKNQLLCTIGSPQDLITTLKQIAETYQLLNGKVRVFESPSTSELFLIYNVITLNEGRSYLKNTMSIHCKKETNTFYTINALNKLIYELNGVLDKNYKIKWDDYPYTIILASDNTLKKISIKYKEQYEV